MCLYLFEPITDKESTDECNDKLDCGASTMQGWRETQEDAHNCILDYDTETSFFAVYDGHYGHEVAEYCAQELPNFIKNTPKYKEGKIKKALTRGFLQFDALVATSEVVEVLRKIASSRPPVRESDDDENEEEDDETDGISSASCSSTEIEEKSEDSDSASNEASAIVDRNKEETKKEAKSSGRVSEKEINELSSSVSKEVKSTQNEESKETQIKNGEISTLASEAEANSDVGSTSTPVENGTPSKKGKKRKRQQLYKEWVDMIFDSEDFDEDLTYWEPNEDNDDEIVNVFVETSEEDSSEEGEEEEDADNIDHHDNEDESDDDEGDNDHVEGREHVPGVENGCTALVAILKGNELYVANAGYSRCVVCRNGKAVAMSFDHKPRKKTESQRIIKAGGSISLDGQVEYENDATTVSRAIGDHFFKQNRKLSDREQLITALPDVKKMTIKPEEDEFLVLASDGIWNSMSRQEVVDFVKHRISEGREKMSQICEEMFDHCISPIRRHGAGTDNMTAIIVRFKSSKGSALLDEENEAKQAKTETDSETQGGSTV